MMLLRIALRNLSRRGRKNIVVAILIAVGIGAFFTGNAVLESSIGGIQRTFSDNFTADLSISERSEQSFSLFGPDIPVIGEYESEPVLLNAAEAGKRISGLPGVAGMAYVLSSPSPPGSRRARDAALGLGVIGDEYFSLFRGPQFIVGCSPGPGDSGWAVITEEWARKIASPGPSARSRGQDPALFLSQPDLHHPGGDPRRNHPVPAANDALKIRRHHGRPDPSSAVRLLADIRMRAAAGRPLPGPAVPGSDSDIDSLFSGTSTRPSSIKSTSAVLGAGEHR